MSPMRWSVILRLLQHFLASDEDSRRHHAGRGRQGSRGLGDVLGRAQVVSISAQDPSRRTRGTRGLIPLCAGLTRDRQRKRRSCSSAGSWSVSRAKELRTGPLLRGPERTRSRTCTSPCGAPRTLCVQAEELEDWSLGTASAAAAADLMGTRDEAESHLRPKFKVGCCPCMRQRI